MGKLTDDDLERLLRETFADKEKLAGNVPQATKRRRPVAPILLAAAAVLAVLAGVLYGVRGGEADPAPPVATASAGDNAEIWAAAIVAAATKYEPPRGWQSLVVLDHAAAPLQPQRAQGAESAGRAFSSAEKDRIADVVDDVVRVTWSSTRTSIYGCTNRGLGEIAVGPVIGKGDHREVQVSIDRECGYSYWLTYRLDKQGDVWTVTGMVGPVQGSVPVSCTQSRPTSPRAGC